MPLVSAGVWFPDLFHTGPPLGRQRRLRPKRPSDTIGQEVFYSVAERDITVDMFGGVMQGISVARHQGRRFDRVRPAGQSPEIWLLEPAPEVGNAPWSPPFIGSLNPRPERLRQARTQGALISVETLSDAAAETESIPWSPPLITSISVRRQRKGQPPTQGDLTSIDTLQAWPDSFAADLAALSATVNFISADTARSLRRPRTFGNVMVMPPEIELGELILLSVYVNEWADAQTARGPYRRRSPFRWFSYPERTPDLPTDLVVTVTPTGACELPFPRRIGPRTPPTFMDPGEFRTTLVWQIPDPLQRTLRRPTIRRNVLDQPLIATPYTAWSLIAPPTNLQAAIAGGGSLPEPVTFYYVVTAYTEAGETIGSNEANATTSLGNQRINLTWDAVLGAAGYRVYRGTSPGGQNVKVADVSVTNYSDIGGATLGNFSPPAANSAGLNTNWEIVTHEFQSFSHPIRYPRRVREGKHSIPQDSDFLGPLPATFVYSPDRPTKIIVRARIGSEASMRLLAGTDEAVLATWQVQPQAPVHYRARVPQQGVHSTVWFGSLAVETLFDPFADTTTKPSRILPRRPSQAATFHAWMPLGDPMAWDVAPQARHMPRPVPTKHEYTAAPPIFSSGAPIIVNGPYYAVAGGIFSPGAVAGQAVTE